ncbi:MAG: hypothetical protein NZ988_03835 [Thaumarchaeota archaeon]|nr:hypothetical protein [Candidatus Calditenuaceae archaeon]MDW8187160.1 hypothetical protein [Nitrososphaerota archaeon]
MSSPKPKREVLALFKEDEEFRHAVAGYIGLGDMRAGQLQLEEKQTRLWESQVCLEEAVAGLVDAQTRTEVTLQELTRQVGRLSPP